VSTHPGNQGAGEAVQGPLARVGGVSLRVLSGTQTSLSLGAIWNQPVAAHAVVLEVHPTGIRLVRQETGNAAWIAYGDILDAAIGPARGSAMTGAGAVGTVTGAGASVAPQSVATAPWTQMGTGAAPSTHLILGARYGTYALELPTRDHESLGRLLTAALPWAPSLRGFQVSPSAVTQARQPQVAGLQAPGPLQPSPIAWWQRGAIGALIIGLATAVSLILAQSAGAIHLRLLGR
jgi:hypothetical protein